MTRAAAMRAVALVVARDEERTVAATVRSVLTLDGLEGVVVVDDGSADRTAGEARTAGAAVVGDRTARGKGGALEAAIERVPAADAYLLVDADTGDSAHAAAPLLATVARGEADLAVGRLPHSVGGGFGMVKRLARALIRVACGLAVDEPLSGQRAITRAALLACRPFAEGFGLETGMTIDAVRLGYRVREVPVAMTHRPTGRSPAGFAHRGRQGLDVLRAAAPRLLGLR